jgi:hypothetical protein
MSPETRERIRQMKAELETRISPETIVTGFQIQLAGIDDK